LDYRLLKGTYMSRIYSSNSVSVLCGFAGFMMLTVASTAPAGIIVVTPPADLVPASLPQTTSLVTPTLDVNGDGKNDFYFVFSQPQSVGTGTDWTSQVGIKQEFGTSLIAVETPPGSFQYNAQRLNAGDTIGPVTPAG